jgi:AcrR family transcriptional regulator
MVQITHCGDNSNRLKEIIEAAQKRFGMYGYEKTAVSEIAADLNLSKASIYYYFADKGELFRAVIEIEHSEFISTVERQNAILESASEMLVSYVEVNITFFRKLLNLTRIKHSEIINNKNILEIIRNFRAKEVAQIEQILTKGKVSKAFEIDDPHTMAILFLDLLVGLRKMTVGKKDVIYLDDDEYDLLVSKVRQFTQIFIKGISKN